MLTNIIGGIAPLLDALRLIEYELLLFAAFWFMLGAVDELAIDLCWLWLRVTGRAVDLPLPAAAEARPLAGRAAVLVPAWHEAEVIAAMVSHTLEAWPQHGLRLYVGCYVNDAATLSAAMAGCGSDPRVRLVVHDRQGPTTKADCLNRLYAALDLDEARCGSFYRSVILHDAEDMVHPAALSLIDRELAHADFVQLPVRPEPQPGSRWIAGHYADEFTEAHANALVVRDALGAAIPAAGVGCGFARRTLETLAAFRRAQGEAGPFAAECLTEDYELGLLVSHHGGKSRFLRRRDSQGALVATRSYFPASLDEAVRQKTRWIHGIAFQGWDRLGWTGGPVDIWMALRDRRGPLTAIVLAAAYGLLVIEGLLGIAYIAGWRESVAVSPALRLLLQASFASFVWRACWRFGFTTREYGMAEGLRSVLRIPLANIIAILSGRRAIAAYVRVLRGEIVNWDKTSHRHHPAMTGAPALAQ